jgi:hypothetical protein
LCNACQLMLAPLESTNRQASAEAHCANAEIQGNVQNIARVLALLASYRKLSSVK